MLYAKLNSETLAVYAFVEMTPAQYAAFNGNPKQAYIRPLVVDAQPVPNASQVLENAGYLVEATQVRQTWALRAKTQAELEGEAREADRQQLVTLVAALSASIATPDVTGTAVERLVKIEARMLRMERIARHYLRGI